jgi:hypothetical protein
MRGLSVSLARTGWLVTNPTGFVRAEPPQKLCLREKRATRRANTGVTVEHVEITCFRVIG